MINQQLLDFIKLQLAKGIDKETITKELLNNGWKSNEIEEGLNEVNNIINNKSPKLFSWKFSIFLIIIQIGLVLRMGYMYTKYQNPGDPMLGLFFDAILLAIFSVIGFLTSIIFLTRKPKKNIFIFLLISSIIAFPYIAVRTARLIAETPLFGESWKDARDAYRNTDEYKLLKAKQLENQIYVKNITKTIVNEFKTPRKILLADTDSNVLLLDNGYVVQLSNNPIDLPGENQKIFIDWAKKNLVGKDAYFKLPNLKSDEDGISGGVQTCDNPGYPSEAAMTKELRRKNGMLEDKGGFCSIILVDINFDNISLFDKFCGERGGSLFCPSVK